MPSAYPVYPIYIFVFFVGCDIVTVTSSCRSSDINMNVYRITWTVWIICPPSYIQSPESTIAIIYI